MAYLLQTCRCSVSRISLSDQSYPCAIIAYSVNWVGTGFKQYNKCGVITYCVDPQ